MGRIVSTFFTTLDSVVESPHEWHGPYFDDAMGAAMTRYQSSVTAYLMGSTLYREWAAYWPGNEDDDFGPFINALPKHVLSNSLTEATWQGSEIVSGSEDEVEAQVRELKARTEGDIGMTGCATTVSWLLRRGLVDELHLFVDPVVVGRGQRLFAADGQQVPLTLLEQTVFPTGVLHLRYAPA